MMGVKRNMIRTVREGKRNWIRHIVRGDSLMKLVLEGRLEGKRMRGRPRMGMIDDLVEESYGVMKRRAENRDNWRIWKPRTCPWACLGIHKINTTLGGTLDWNLRESCSYEI